MRVVVSVVVDHQQRFVVVVSTVAAEDTVAEGLTKQVWSQNLVWRAYRHKVFGDEGDPIAVASLVEVVGGDNNSRPALCLFFD